MYLIFLFLLYLLIGIYVSCYAALHNESYASIYLLFWPFYSLMNHTIKPENGDCGC